MLVSRTFTFPSEFEGHQLPSRVMSEAANKKGKRNRRQKKHDKKTRGKNTTYTTSSSASHQLQDDNELISFDEEDDDLDARVNVKSQQHVNTTTTEEEDEDDYDAYEEPQLKLSPSTQIVATSSSKATDKIKSSQKVKKQGKKRAERKKGNWIKLTIAFLVTILATGGTLYWYLDDGVSTDALLPDLSSMVPAFDVDIVGLLNPLPVITSSLASLVGALYMPGGSEVSPQSADEVSPIELAIDQFEKSQGDLASDEDILQAEREQLEREAYEREAARTRAARARELELEAKAEVEEEKVRREHEEWARVELERERQVLQRLAARELEEREWEVAQAKRDQDERSRLLYEAEERRKLAVEAAEEARRLAIIAAATAKAERAQRDAAEVTRDEVDQWYEPEVIEPKAQEEVNEELLSAGYWSSFDFSSSWAAGSVDSDGGASEQVDTVEEDVGGQCDVNGNGQCSLGREGQGGDDKATPPTQQDEDDTFFYFD